MKIALIQFSPIWEEKETNMEVIERIIGNLEVGTSIIIFPEMTLTGFTMNVAENGEEIDGIGIKYFMNMASKLKIDVFAGVIEKADLKFFNSLFHFDSKGFIKAVYRKIHPFTLAEENKHLERGKKIVSTNYNNHKIGLSICYDLRFPELYRFYAKENAEILINIANWPNKRIEHWKTLLKARAIENQCYMIGVNRIGSDPYQEYNGCSAVIDPMGKEVILVDNDNKILYANIDFSFVNEVREKFGFLNDIKLI